MEYKRNQFCVALYSMTLIFNAEIGEFIISCFTRKILSEIKSTFTAPSPPHNEPIDFLLGKRIYDALPCLLSSLEIR